MSDEAKQDDAEPKANSKKTTKKTTKRKSTKKKTKRKAKAGKRKASKKKSSSKRVAVAASNAARPNRRSYPQLTLEDSLALAQAIKTQNNGNPIDTEMAAKAVGSTKSANKFFYLAASSRDYGLTTGSRDTDQIELTDLGRNIVFAGSEEDREAGLLKAFFSVEVFSNVFEYYSGSNNLPTKPEFLSNVLLTEFKLPNDFHDDFVKNFVANCKYLGIEKGIGSKQKPSRQSDIEVAETSDVRVVGEPKGKFDRTAFVIMPFSEKGDNPRPEGYFTEVLEGLITPAANTAGFAVETANQHGSDVIQSTIIRKLLAADLVIADLSDHNPNVLFELGVRLTKELPVAIIKAEGTPQVFDVDNMLRVVRYSPNLWASTIKSDVPKLAEHIKASWDNASTTPNYMQILTGSTQ